MCPVEGERTRVCSVTAEVRYSGLLDVTDVNRAVLNINHPYQPSVSSITRANRILECVTQLVKRGACPAAFGVALSAACASGSHRF